MRIISGSHKGRTIPIPKNFNARPTTDFAKEGLFNILTNNIDFDETVVLDLFSGTGSISYEMASRGCQQITAVENNFQNYKLIKTNSESLKLNAIHVIKADVFQYLKTCRSKFNLIFSDPPYELEGLDTLPDIIFKKDMLIPEGWFILEHSKQFDFQNHPNFEEQRNYGSVHFSFFRNQSEITQKTI